MPSEAVLERPETHVESKYTHKSFELVFGNFCKQYSERIEQITGHPASENDRFLGLPTNASWTQMAERLNQARHSMGEPPSWPDEGEVSEREAVLYSARYLAWFTTTEAITKQYVDRIQSEIHRNRHNKNHVNINRLRSEGKVGLTILLAQHHAIRDYFDSGLAKKLGNDSPQAMDELLSKVSQLRDHERQALVSGISLEIAAKRYLESVKDSHRSAKVAFGDSGQDALGGDLVVTTGHEVTFIDVKSSMPEAFYNFEPSTELDFERGYKWVDSTNVDRAAVVWAYSSDPVESDSFTLIDARFAHNLAQVANS